MRALYSAAAIFYRGHLEDLGAVLEVLGIVVIIVRKTLQKYGDLSIRSKAPLQIAFVLQFPCWISIYFQGRESMFHVGIRYYDRRVLVPTRHRTDVDVHALDQKAVACAGTADEFETVIYNDGHLRRLPFMG